MNQYEVYVEPASLEGLFDGDSEDDAIAAALDAWCPCLGEATDAICAGTFVTRLVSE